MKNGSFQSLSEQTGATRKSVTRWLREAGMEPSDPKALELCQQKHLKHAAPMEDDPARFDPETGLSWHVKKTKEEAQKLARENLIADKLLNQTYMLVDDHLEVIGLVAEKLNLLPGRAKSELGLSDSQIARLTRMLDEARAVAARNIEKGAT